MVRRTRRVRGGLIYMGTTREPRSNQPTPSLNPSPAGPEIMCRADGVRYICRTVRHPFFALVFGCPFSGIFQNVDDLWLPFWLHFGLLWLQFCTPFSDLFFYLIFLRFPSISGTLNPRKPWFYCSKTMIFAKPPNLNNLRKTLISYHILTSFLKPFGFKFEH